MDPIPAVEVPIESPKPPPRPELHVVVCRYGDTPNDWILHGPITTKQGAQETAKNYMQAGAIDVAIFRLPAEAPAPSATHEDWRAACKVVKCADDLWDVRTPDDKWWYAEGPRKWQRGYSGQDEDGIFANESAARRALAAAPKPPEGGQ